MLNEENIKQIVNDKKLIKKLAKKINETGILKKENSSVFFKIILTTGAIATTIGGIYIYLNKTPENIISSTENFVEEVGASNLKKAACLFLRLFFVGDYIEDCK